MAGFVDVPYARTGLCAFRHTVQSIDNLLYVARIAAGRMSNNNNAFIDPDIHVEATKPGPLTGLTFAAKDLFDVSQARICNKQHHLFGSP